jgi:hypothetical protein
MRRLMICASAVALGAAVLALPAQAAEPMKASAPDKMMPSGDAEKMRACDKKAMDQAVKMEDRADFVKKCMGMK